MLVVDELIFELCLSSGEVNYICCSFTGRRPAPKLRLSSGVFEVIVKDSLAHDLFEKDLATGRGREPVQTRQILA